MNTITKKDSDLINALASEAVCSRQDPRASKFEGICCHEEDIIYDCSKSEFVQDGYKCIENGNCFDVGKSEVKINNVMVKAVKARCPRSNQICCKQKDSFPEKEAIFDKCEDHEGTVWHFYLNLSHYDFNICTELRIFLNPV